MEINCIKEKTQEYLWEYKNVQHNKVISTVSGTQLKIVIYTNEEKN